MHYQNTVQALKRSVMTLLEHIVVHSLTTRHKGTHTHVTVVILPVGHLLKPADECDKNV